MIIRHAVFVDAASASTPSVNNPSLAA